MDDRRQHPRHRVFRLEVKVASRDTFRASYLKDLSEGGLFVRSAKPLPSGAKVAIELTAPGASPLKLTGTVARVVPATEGRSGGFGVRFDELDAASMAALHALIASYLPAVESTSDLVALQTELSDARGAIEAYEETISLLRESEMEAVQKLENVEAERMSLARVAAELELRAMDLEGERARLDEALAQAQEQLGALHAREAAFADEMAATREQLQHVQHTQVDQVREKAKREHEAAIGLRAKLESEMLQLRQQLSAEGLDEMRSELRRVTSELDDEKLKSMSLERAIERFKLMGGKT